MDSGLGKFPTFFNPSHAIILSLCCPGYKKDIYHHESPWLYSASEYSSSLFCTHSEWMILYTILIFHSIILSFTFVLIVSVISEVSTDTREIKRNLNFFSASDTGRTFRIFIQASFHSMFCNLS